MQLSWQVREFMKKTTEKFWTGLAWHMPKQLVYWCLIRATAHATTGKYSDTVLPEITAVEVADRWKKGDNTLEESNVYW